MNLEVIYENANEVKHNTPLLLYMEHGMEHGVGIKGL